MSKRLIFSTSLSLFMLISCNHPKEKEKEDPTVFKIHNTTSLKVVELYHQKIETGPNGDSGLYKFPNYFGGISAFDSTELTFIFNEHLMEIEDDSSRQIPKQKEINGRIKPILNSRELNQSTYTTSMGTFRFMHVAEGCQDTKFNSFHLQSNGKDLEINGLLNCEIFTIDSDDDGIEEIYIFSFRSCDWEMKVLRISKN